jgi:probable rRNA maturation factor
MTTIVNLGVKIPSFVSRKELKHAVKDLVITEGKKLKDLSLVFTDDDYLLEVNKQYLNHDYFTDVITFDYSSFPNVAGDVMISLDRVKDNAASMNLDYETEFYRVVFHGVLHLCGYKDKRAEDAKEMRAKEDFYINRFVSRETNPH